MIGKVEDDGVVGKVCGSKCFEDATNVMVEVFDHSIITIKAIARLGFNTLYRWHIGAKLYVVWVVAVRVFGWRDIR